MGNISEANDYSRADKKLDIYIYENFFFGMRGGLILESGGSDGIFQSNSFMFVKLFHWSAVLVGNNVFDKQVTPLLCNSFKSEGDIHLFESLSVNRPDSINVRAPLCNESKVLHYVNSGHECCRGIIEFMAPSYIKDWHENVNISNLPSIHCITMKYLLSSLAILEADIWFLDVEGAEESVLLVSLVDEDLYLQYLYKFI